MKERDAASLERWLRVLVELGHSPPQEAVELLLQLLSKNPSVCFFFYHLLYNYFIVFMRSSERAHGDYDPMAQVDLMDFVS